MANLTGVNAKLQRAMEHLATIDKSLALWKTSNPSPITGKSNADKTEHRFYVTLDEEPPLVRWGILLGDCVHNLRSALDHLVWELSAGKGSRATEFPVSQCERDFRREDRGGGAAKIKWCKDSRQLALFEKFQPWKNPNGIDSDSLWLIHEFDREDKHRILQPVLIRPTVLASDVVVEYASEEIARNAPAPLIVLNDKPLQNGAEAFSIHLTVPPEKVKVNAKLTLGVTIEYNGRRGGLTGTLGHLCQHASRIVEEFRNVL